MGLGQFIRKQFIDVIQWTEVDDAVLAYRFPMQDMEIQMGAQLVVRESQAAVFVNDGRLADGFGPGRHRLDTENLPLLTNLRNWPPMWPSSDCGSKASSSRACRCLTSCSNGWTSGLVWASLATRISTRGFRRRARFPLRRQQMMTEALRPIAGAAASKQSGAASYCAQCGTALTAAANFCPECGTKR